MNVILRNVGLMNDEIVPVPIINFVGLRAIGYTLDVDYYFLAPAPLTR
jgi:hypothetical protein